MTTDTQDHLTDEQRAELAEAITEFDAVGGRSVTLAGRIVELQTIAEYGQNAHLIAEYVDNLHGDDGGLDTWDGETTVGFILVEQANSDGGYWITQHDNPQSAADYHDMQEYAEDYEIVELIDIATGESFEAHTDFVTRFDREPDPVHDRIVTWCREAALETFVPIFELIRQRGRIEDEALAEAVERLDLNDLYAVTLGPIIDAIEETLQAQVNEP